MVVRLPTIKRNALTRQNIMRQMIATGNWCQQIRGVRRRAGNEQFEEDLFAPDFDAVDVNQPRPGPSKKHQRKREGDASFNVPQRSQMLNDKSVPNWLSDILPEKRRVYHRQPYQPDPLSFSHIPLEEQVTLLFPDQGNQFVGMGRKLSNDPKSAELFDEASTALGYNVSSLCMNGPKSELDKLYNAQTSTFVMSMAAFEKLKAEKPNLCDHLTVTAGFGVGELSALVAGGALTFSDALKLLKVRAQAMQECCQHVRSGMLTVRVFAASQLNQALNEARNEVSETCPPFEATCEIAYWLFCGVKVIGGTEPCLKFLEQNDRIFNFRAIKRLPVPCAFHTRIMEPASETLKEFFSLPPEQGGVRFRTPRCNIYSNSTGKVYGTKLTHFPRFFGQQVREPLLWGNR